MIIGICGKSGSGKSVLAEKIVKLTNNEALHLDIDKIGHKILLISKVKKELINTFGNEIVTDNNIDRKKLGKIVFNSKEKMKILSNITWKYIDIDINKFLVANKGKNNNS